MLDPHHLISQWGYFAIGLVVILGNIGLPVPEETVLVLAGYLAWRGQLQWPLVLVVGIVSAVAGDNVGYWLGRRYGRGIVDRCARWALVTPERLAGMRRFVIRYGPLGVFAGRFLSGLRFLAGPLAEATGLRFHRFFVANEIGALVFVPYDVSLGYEVGYGMGDYVAQLRHVEQMILVGVVVGVVAFVGWRVWGRCRVSSRR